MRSFGTLTELIYLKETNSKNKSQKRQISCFLKYIFYSGLCDTLSNSIWLTIEKATCTKNPH